MKVNSGLPRITIFQKVTANCIVRDVFIDIPHFQFFGLGAVWNGAPQLMKVAGRNELTFSLFADSGAIY